MRFLPVICMLLSCVFSAQAQTSSAKWKIIEMQADTLMDRQDFEGAIKLYNQVIELSKLKERESKGVLYKRSVCYYSIAEFDKALQDINAFIPDFSNVPQAKLLRAFIFRELGNNEGQLNDINDLLAGNPLNPDLLKWKSAVLLDSEKFEEAKNELINIRKFANDEEIETQLGFAFFSLEEPDSAFVHFDNALAMNAGYVPAYLYMSSLCLEQEAYSMALTYIDLGLKLEPDNNNLLFYKGIAFVETDKRDEGCRYISKAFIAGLDQAGDYLKQYCYSSEE
jgi:tetratricopeptide (TPR) repeat protein